MEELNTLQKQLIKIWHYTELDLDDFSTVGLKKHLSSISHIVNDLLDDLDNYKTCSICTHHICTECLDDMAEEFNKL